jgi:hypothetical protein
MKKIFVVARGRERWVVWECCGSISPKVATALSNPDVAFDGEEPRTAERI